MINLNNLFKNPPSPPTSQSLHVPANLSIMLISNSVKKLEHFNDGDLETTLGRLNKAMEYLENESGDMNFEQEMTALRRLDDTQSEPRNTPEEM